MKQRLQTLFLAVFVFLQLCIFIWQIRPILAEFSFQPGKIFPFPPASISFKRTTRSPGKMLPATSYQAFLQQLEKTHKKIALRYQRCWKEKEKKRLVKESREFVLKSISEKIFPSWFGTAWSFSGKTDHPKEGSIACGIFVATVLNHAGFSLDRIRLGIQPSRYLITNLTGEETCWQLSGRSISEIKQELVKRGRNLYVVSLDKHTGFIFCDGRGKVIFVHSSGQKGIRQVVAEELEKSDTLKKSRYFILGAMFGEKMMEHWLTGKYLPVECDYYRQVPKALVKAATQKKKRIRHG